MRLLIVAVALPLILLASMVPAVRPLWAQWQLTVREPTWAWPVGGPSHYTLRQDAYGSGEFGSHRRGARAHNGIDLVAPVGMPIKAANSGLVRYGRKHNGMGIYLEVHHRHGFTTLYGHLSRVLVADGQWVRRGQTLGLVGKSGNARARRIQPHLHFELRLRGVPVDPLDGFLEGTKA